MTTQKKFIQFMKSNTIKHIKDETNTFLYIGLGSTEEYKMLCEFEFACFITNIKKYDTMYMISLTNLGLSMIQFEEL
jgi:hypothetical protein